MLVSPLGCTIHESTDLRVIDTAVSPTPRTVPGIERALSECYGNEC